MSIQFLEAGFVALTVLMAALVVWAVRRTGTTRSATLTALGVTLWLAFTAALAHSGALSHFDWKPPTLLRLLIPTVIATTLLAFSGWGTRLASQLPLWVIVASQSFRIPVELLLLGLYKAGAIPVQMTFEGGNFDVVTGLLALIVAWRLRTKSAPALALGWNVLGMMLLTTIVVIANLSAPTPFRMFHTGPSSAVIATAPLIWLPVFLVQLALLGHLLVFRALAMQRRVSPAARPMESAKHAVTAAAGGAAAS